METNDALQRRIDDAKVEGWSLDEQQGDDRAVMVRRGYGTLGAHGLVFLLTIWWTFGLGNVLYAAKKYFYDADKRVIRVDNDGD